MKSIRGFQSTRLAAQVAVLAALATGAVGCASKSSNVKMEPRSIAARLGMPECRVSVPLSPSEVISTAKMDGSNEPEKNPDWIKLAANLQPSDELRMINCLKTTRQNRVTGSFFYALIRNDEILFRFYSAIVD